MELELPTGNLSCLTKNGYPSKVVVLGKIRGKPQTCRWVEIVEGRVGGPQVAASLTYPDHEGKVWIQVMNHTESVLNPPADTETGWCREIDEGDVTPVWESTELPDSQTLTVEENVRALNSQSREPTPEVPEHLLKLYHNTTKSDLTKEQRHKLAGLLQQHSRTFSKGSHDQGRTNLVEHHIPLVPGAHLIR